MGARRQQAEAMEAEAEEGEATAEEEAAMAVAPGGAGRDKGLSAEAEMALEGTARVVAVVWVAEDSVAAAKEPEEPAGKEVAISAREEWVEGEGRVEATVEATGPEGSKGSEGTAEARVVAWAVAWAVEARALAVRA